MIKTANTPLQVLIVGCGNIAGGFDESRPSGYLPFTHAGAYARDGRFGLAACVEPDDNRRGAFMEAWGIPVGFRSVEEAVLSGNGFDVVSICSPTDYHVHDLEMALRMKPKLIFCEKPLAPSVSESQKLIAQCAQLGILLAVNYTRRWDADVLKLQADMQAGRWGELRAAVGYYNKGILNNGSHMMDLLHLLVGPMVIVQVGQPVHDFFPYDPTVPAWLEGASGLPVQLVCGHAGDYALFELQLVFSLGVVIMEEGGMSWCERRVMDSGTFKGYRVLDHGARRAGQYPGAMLCAVDNIYRAVKQGAPLASTGGTAYAAQQLCGQIRQQAYGDTL